MQLNVDTPQLALDAGQVVSLDDAAGTRIEARLGSVWITEEGSQKDNVLGPGETFTVAHGGRTVVQAIKASWITIAPGRPAANDAFVEAANEPLDVYDADMYLADLRHRIYSRYY
jgi:hypothetical protein